MNTATLSRSSTSRADRGGRGARFLRGREDDPSWARPALLALLAATAALYLWNLTSNGYANAFYSAAAQAGSDSWKAFFFGSSDASSAITVDKPPASLWLMALSVRVLGLSSFSVLLPQAVTGVATVGVVYAIVRRCASAPAALLAGGVMALTPVAVLMFRFNNPDALLTLLMALGAWATLKSIERGSVGWMAIVGVFIGLGFLTKTLQVLLVVPFFGVAYLVAARTTLRRRVIGTLAAIASTVLSAGWWVAIVELIPADARPYIGGSQTNSFLELTFGYNGLGRINGNEAGSVGGGGWGESGWSRMFSASIGGQISWLIPSALIFLVVGLILRGRAPRTDLRRAAYLVLGGWLLVTMAVFSFMAGIFHEYYTVALAPAIAVLVGIGGWECWQARDRTIGSVSLAAATAAAATWSFILLSRTTEYGSLRVAALAIGMAAALLFLALNWLHHKAIPVILLGAIAAGLAGPTAYTLTTVQESRSGSIVTAGPSTGGTGGGPGGGRPGRGGQPPGGNGAAPRGNTQAGGGPGQPGGRNAQPPGSNAPPDSGNAQALRRPTGGDGGGGGGMGGLLNATTASSAVTKALQKRASDYTWVAAATGSQNAAGLQLGSGEPVMALGGFNGSDPSPPLAQFKQYVTDGQIHYFLASSGGGPGGRSGTAGQIGTWVQAHFTTVTVGSQTFYDLTKPADD